VRERADRARIDRLLRTIGRRLRRPVRLYLVGGTIVVDRGLRADTFDVDFVARADDPAALDEFERLVPILKDELQTNLEPASPGDFIPVPSNVLDRAQYVRSYGQLTVYHYDLPTTIISKPGPRNATSPTWRCWCARVLCHGRTSNPRGRRSAPASEAGSGIPGPTSSAA
jgi:hypothetical protein